MILKTPCWAPSLIILLLAAGCSSYVSTPLPTTTASSTVPAATLSPEIAPTSVDCSPEHTSVELQSFHSEIRKFDDYASLATYVASREQVSNVTPRMERIRSEIQSRPVSSCLNDLRRLAVQYMDAMLVTLQAFQQPTPDAIAITDGFIQAGKQHDQYLLEYSRLLGATLTPEVSPTVTTPTP